MKNFVIMITAFLISACSGNVRTYDMNSKGVIGGTFSIQDEEMRLNYVPSKVFFKKLDNPDSIDKGVIIPSSVKDEDGNFVINYDPGVYVAVAAVRNAGTTNVIVIFNEDLISKTKTELKAGEKKIFNKIYVVDYRGSILGGPSKLQDIHKSAIEKTINFSSNDFHLGVINKDMYRIKKTKEEKIEEDKKKEEKEKENRVIEEFK